MKAITTITAWMTAVSVVLTAAGPGQASGADQTHAKKTPGPVTVLQRAKLGNYIEDLDFVTTGSFAHHLVALAGYEVYGMPATSNSDRAFHKLFDLRRMAITFPPKSFAFVPSERLFAFIDTALPTTLLLCDDKGNPVPPRTITYIDDYFPFVLDGLAYVPPSSPHFPDHLIMNATTDFVDWRIEVIRRDGQVVAEIPSPEIVTANFGYAASVTFAAPDRLVVGTGGEIWTLDFAGNVVSGPVVTNTELLFDDGLTQIGDGRIVSSFGARLLFYDAALNRLPNDDRDAGTGVHLTPWSISWNSDSNSHLLIAAREDAAGTATGLHIAEVRESLDSAVRFADLPNLDPFRRVLGLAFVADEHLIAVGRARRGTLPAEIHLYDSAGTIVERVNTAAVGSPLVMSFIPTTRQFAVRTPSALSRLRFLARSGALEREIDFSSLFNFIAVAAYFDPGHPSGGRFLAAGSPFFDDSTRAVVTDFEGNLLAEFDYRRRWVSPHSTACRISPLAIAPAHSAPLICWEVNWWCFA